MRSKEADQPRSEAQVSGGGGGGGGGGELLGCLRLYYEIFEKLQYPASNAKKLVQHVKTIAGNPPGLTRNFKNLSRISFLSRIKF